MSPNKSLSGNLCWYNVKFEHVFPVLCYFPYRDASKTETNFKYDMLQAISKFIRRGQGWEQRNRDIDFKILIRCIVPRPLVHPMEIASLCDSQEGVVQTHQGCNTEGLPLAKQVPTMLWPNDPHDLFPLTILILITSI